MKEFLNWIWGKLEIAGGIVLAIVVFFSTLYQFLKMLRKGKEKDIKEAQEVLENKERSVENKKSIRSISGELRTVQDNIKDLEGEIKITQANMGNLKNCVEANTNAIKALKNDNDLKDKEMKEFIITQNNALLEAIRSDRGNG